MIDALKYTESIRELCLRHYVPSKTLADGKPNPKDHPIMRSEAISAASCMVSIARVFKLLEVGEPSFMLAVVIDLSFGLSENQFWKQHSDVLVPSYKSALHAYISALSLRADKVKSVEKDAIAEVQSKQWYNLFLVAYDCLYGMVETVGVSPLLLQELSRIV